MSGGLKGGVAANASKRRGCRDSGRIAEHMVSSHAPILLCMHRRMPVLHMCRAALPCPAGFREQTKGWPLQPVDQAIRWLRGRPPGWEVADLGCGDAKIAATVQQASHMHIGVRVQAGG